jgi:hypothetical protein
MPSELSKITHPFIYEINTWPWLESISRTEGRAIDLGTVPDRYWDEIADLGFDGCPITWHRIIHGPRTSRKCLCPARLRTCRGIRRRSWRLADEFSPMAVTPTSPLGPMWFSSMPSPGAPGCGDRDVEADC